MKRTLTITCTLLAVVLMLAGSAVADVVGPPISLRTGGVAGGPMLLDTIHAFQGYSPGGSSDLGYNTDTGRLYAMDTYSHREVVRMDSDYEYEKGQTVIDAGTGRITTNTNGYWYKGAVSGGVDAWTSGGARMGVTYDPYMVTNDGENSYSGIVTYAEIKGGADWLECVAQTGTDEIGQMNEGTVTSRINTTGVVTYVALSAPSSFEHWYGLEMDRFKGQFTPDNDAHGERKVSRYFMGMGDYSFTSVIVVHANAARDTEPTTTAWGTRTAGRRDNSDTQSLLISTTDFAGLVPLIDDTGGDMAQNPVTGDLYFLSKSGADETYQAYLSAIRPTIPDDSDEAMSFEVVDLDPDTDNTYLALSSFHGDLAGGVGLTFNGDGKVLYISVGNVPGVEGAVQAVYALDVPEPATMGLLGLGFAGMAALRRRRRNAS